MVIENLQLTPPMEWLLGPGWTEGVLWQPMGIVLLVVLLVGGGMAGISALRRGAAAPSAAASLWIGSVFAALSLLILVAVALCSTEITRSWLSDHVAGPVFSGLVPLLGKDWTAGSLYTWLGVVVGLTGVIYTLAWLISTVVGGPLAGTLQCGRGVIGMAADLSRLSSRRVFALAWLAVRESIRRRVWIVFAVFVLVILGAALFIKKDSLHPGQLYIQVVLNFTIYLTMLFALILSALSLPADIRDRTLHTVVTKPVRKIEIVLGRVLGFVFVGTLLLGVIGLISYGFTVRSLSHTHDLTAAMLHPQPLPGGHGVLLRGTTSRSHEHVHEVTIDPLGNATVEAEKDHTHDLYVSGSGDTAVYTLGPPVGLLQARVPIYSKTLSFLDKTGTAKEKGICVGDEWTYRSFIEGRTLAAAIWTFEGLSAEMFPETEFPRGIPVEMTLEVFRTHKGNQEKGVSGTITLGNPKTKRKVLLRNFLAKKFATDVQMIPRSFVTAGSDGKAETIHLFPYFQLSKASLATLGDAQLPGEVLAKLAPLAQEKETFETREELAGKLAGILNADQLRLFGEQITGAARQPGMVSDDGRLEIIIQCLEAQQYYGMAQPDLYIRATDSSFALNFFKGYLGIWLQMALVVSLGVMFSTFVSGPVALLATMFAIIAGLFSGYIVELSGGKMVGGGPFESAQRIMTQDNMISDLEPGIKTSMIKAADAATAVMLRFFSALVPDVSDNDFVDRVAYGFNVGRDLLNRCLLWELAYLVPVIFLGYFFLREREVAQ